MQVDISTYIPGQSFVHRLDARVKIILLLVYSAAIFFVDTWWGMLAAGVMFVVALLASGIPLRRVFGLVVPVYVLAGLTIVFNSFMVLTPGMAVEGTAGFSTGTLVPLFGSFTFTLSGFLRGCFFACRILLLVFASLVVCFTSTSASLTDALHSFLQPLRVFRVPVDDVAMVFSITLRFIPVTAEEFWRIRNAQWSRGAPFDEGGPLARLGAWKTVMIPLFVGLFRRADTLACAMDARCYGAADARTTLHRNKVMPSSVVTLICGVILCVAMAVLL